jgi:hypothetical protein
MMIHYGTYNKKKISFTLLFFTHTVNMRFVLLLLVFFCLLIKETKQYPLTSNSDNRHKGQSEKSCQLMDGFSILIQLCLAFTVLTALLYKRSKESPQRPMQIWCVIYVLEIIRVKSYK